jgi:predicted Fe-Mo cluster-binding NifX family protein
VVVCLPVTVDGAVDHSWGRAGRVAVAEVTDGRVASWEEFEVGWDALHDAAGEGGHHARVARFLIDHGVDAVAAGHMGPPMEHMLGKMGLRVALGASGDGRQAALAVASGPTPE